MKDPEIGNDLEIRPMEIALGGERSSQVGVVDFARVVGNDRDLVPTDLARDRLVVEDQEMDDPERKVARKKQEEAGKGKIGARKTEEDVLQERTESQESSSVGQT